MKRLTSKFLENNYTKYNHRQYVHPDPLEFLYNYKSQKDVEIVGLIASSLAYGRVAQILKSVALVLRTIGSPSLYVESVSPKELKADFRAFKHRFTKGSQIVALIFGIGRMVETHGSLKRSFASKYRDSDENVISAMTLFVEELVELSKGNLKGLIPDPTRGSACKRMNLFLRWMVRHDQVDPGGWSDIHPSKLIIPLDTHMYQIAVSTGFTKRKSADMRTALEITKRFARFCPDDPVKYDFALTRPGIRGE